MAKNQKKYTQEFKQQLVDLKALVLVSSSEEQEYLKSQQRESGVLKKTKSVMVQPL